jgi:hypothetical protein
MDFSDTWIKYNISATENSLNNLFCICKKFSKDVLLSGLEQCSDELEGS